MVLQKCSSESIFVWVGVAALSSITVTTAGTLCVINWNLYGSSPTIWLPKATVSTLAVTTVSPPHHGEDNSADKNKTTEDRASYDGRQVPFDLTDRSDRRKLKGRTEMNVPSQAPLLCRHPQRHRKAGCFRR